MNKTRYANVILTRNSKSGKCTVHFFKIFCVCMSVCYILHRECYKHTGFFLAFCNGVCIYMYKNYIIAFNQIVVIWLFKDSIQNMQNISDWNNSSNMSLKLQKGTDFICFPWWKCGLSNSIRPDMLWWTDSLFSCICSFS